MPSRWRELRRVWEKRSLKMKACTPKHASERRLPEYTFPLHLPQDTSHHRSRNRKAFLNTLLPSGRANTKSSSFLSRTHKHRLSYTFVVSFTVRGSPDFVSSPLTRIHRSNDRLPAFPGKLKEGEPRKGFIKDPQYEVL